MRAHLALPQPAQKDFNATALSLALRNFNSHFVKLIFTNGRKHGSTVCGRDWQEYPALHVATLDNDLPALRKLLLEDVFGRIIEGETSLTKGEEGDSLQTGVENPGPDAGKNIFIRSIKSFRHSPNSVAKGGYTPLHVAAHFGHEEIVKVPPGPFHSARSSACPPDLPAGVQF